MNAEEGMVHALYAALAKAQGEMTGATKDAKNPHFKSQYATLASVVDVVRGPLSRHGIAWVQTVACEANTVSVETWLHHSSGGSLGCGVLVASAKDSSPQAIGSTLTYLRRYSLMAALGVPAEDDDGESAQPRVQPIAPREPNPVDHEPQSVDEWLTSIGKPQIADRDAQQLDALRRVLAVGGAQRSAYEAHCAAR
jgi:hypothetical protein